MIPDCPIVDSLIEILDKAREDLSSSNLTNKIFFMYLDWYDAFLNNLHAERLGLWDEYVSSLKGMTPYQAAGARRSYTKCNKWFLDTILDLDEDTKAVLRNGGFVVWRSEEPYGAVSPDLNTEQTLMAQVKGRSGMTRGRTFSEVNYTTWVLNRPVLCMLDKQLKSMTGYTCYTGQGAVKPLRESRIARDCADVARLKAYFTERMVFDRFVVSNTMKSISSGVVAPSSVDIQYAYSKGVQCMKSLEGSNPTTVKIPKAALCIQMPSTTEVTLPETGKKIDANLLFQRSLAQASNPDRPVTLEDCLAYELSPKPTSMFTDAGLMRSTNKAELAKCLVDKYDCLVNSGDLPPITTTVIDGGALLHRIPWTKNSQIDEIKASYLNFVSQGLKSPNSNSKMVVFDGYLESSTKDYCHIKRHPVQGMRIQFDEQTKILSKKTTFLSNPKNKEQFVDSLAQTLEVNGIEVEKCRCDADISIATAALGEAQSGRNVVLWGDDTDLLVLLLHGITLPPSGKVYMYRPSSDTCIDVSKLAQSMDANLRDVILAVHAISGCDTTSAFYGIGKTKLWKLLLKGSSTLHTDLQKFYAAEHDGLEEAGVRILIALYDKVKSKHTNLESLRLWLVKANITI